MPRTGYDRAFQAGSGRLHWVYVIIDKFSKWIEYKPLVSGTTKKAAELLDEIIHRFGLPNSIITDLRSRTSAMTEA
jgi:transposase-like protein